MKEAGGNGPVDPLRIKRDGTTAQILTLVEERAKIEEQMKEG